MNDDQLRAFTEGAAGKFTAGDTALLFASALAAVSLIWFTWTAIRTYQGYAKGDLNSNEAGGVVIRAALILTVLLFLLKI